MPFRPKVLGIAVAASFVLVAGCSFLFKLRADKVVVLTWLKAPAIDVAPFNQIPDLNMTTATAFFAQGGFNPTPVTGGFATFFGRGQQFVMTERNPEGAPGIYIATSLDDPERGLPYDSDENRRFGMKACIDKIEETGCIGEEFTLTRIRAAPELPKDQMQFEPALQPPDPLFQGFDGAIDGNTDLTVIFPEPSDEFRYHALVTVFGPTQGGTPGIVFNSLPLQGPDIVKFITEDPPLRITIPADKFQVAGPYLVLVAAARLNLDSSENVLVGAAIAGALTAFFVEVKGDFVLPPGFQLPEGLDGGIPNIPGGFDVSQLQGQIPGLRRR